MTYRGRFAPSPTGPLHLGSLVAAVGSWVRARQRGGVWLVRVEDIDPPREIPGAAAGILKTLSAFGLESDEPVIYQSERADEYRAKFARITPQVYRCWCSRADLDAFGGIHPAACVAPPDPSRAPAWRVRVPNAPIGFVDQTFGPQAQNLRDEVGDFVVLRTEGWFAYQLAVVVDDDAQHITEVVRGADLLDSTPRQIYLQHLLGYSTPAYLHLPIVLGEDGRKLSKQDRARPVDRSDPLPALRSALAFLGIQTGGATSRIDDSLRAAIDQFDASRLLAVPRES
ncbi:MAG TPA: tRNA glutamyl-Q(34) synthetase GluQRS [Rudaea sp.]|nr:tRNA glutamyl-Q(34) synthetase GluQRS [Rudaea sp.]